MIVVDFLAIHANQKMESPFQLYGRHLYDFNLSSCNYIALSPKERLYTNMRDHQHVFKFGANAFMPL